MLEARDVPLATLTSLRLGGPAKRLVQIDREEDLVQALAEAERQREPVLVLGGGSNLVVADAGFDGTVLRMASRGVSLARGGDRVRANVAAGEPWDGFVERCVAERLSGVECLSGIPGRVGATPIQNVGAYGQEVSDTIAVVRVLDRASGVFRDVLPSACRFGYRSSVFRGDPRYVVVNVTFDLSASTDSAPIRYAELSRALGVGEAERAPLSRVRATVLALRSGKGMVLDPGDADSVSAGSFFVNPTLSAADLAALDARVAETGVLGVGEKMPRFAAPEGRSKVSAAWLIERAGFTKGYGRGPVGVSRKHALALVNRGGASAEELLELAREIRRGVKARFGVELAPEPVLVGCAL